MSVEESGALDAFDLARTFVHLGRGSTATPLSDFAWSPEYLDAYAGAFAADGREGRLVCVIAQDATWDGWERHPAGDEVVVLLSGRVDVVQDLDGADARRGAATRRGDGQPANVWHTARVHEPGQALFITPGAGTEHRPLA